MEEDSESSPAVIPATPVSRETVSQAAERWFADLQRDKSAALRETTIEDRRRHVQGFVKQMTDLPLTQITREVAQEFQNRLKKTSKTNATVNAYIATLANVFGSASTADNPFKIKALKKGGESYAAFEVSELHTLFDALPREVRPKKHSPETALPWVSLIAAYTGACLEEIAQLTVSDIKNVQANGGTLDVIDIHNGDDEHRLKNDKARVRVVPIHSELCRAGLLDYVRALPKHSPLFPGLTRRASKGGKIGTRLGELFRKRLIALGLKRERLVFHSFRHTVGGRLEAAGVSQTDAARVLGHNIPGMSYGVYSTGPGLKRLAAVVEAIEYPSLRIPSAS